MHSGVFECFRKTSDLCFSHLGTFRRQSAREFDCKGRWHENQPSATRLPSRRSSCRTPRFATPSVTVAAALFAPTIANFRLAVDRMESFSEEWGLSADTWGSASHFFLGSRGAAGGGVEGSFVHDVHRKARSFISCCRSLRGSYLNGLRLPFAHDLGRDGGVRSTYAPFLSCACIPLLLVSHVLLFLSVTEGQPGRP